MSINVSTLKQLGTTNNQFPFSPASLVVLKKPAEPYTGGVKFI
jgi:hypothetical protein